MKLLLAEDTRDLNRAVTAVLEHNGYETDSVFDGEEALSLLRENVYDCVILDIMMPKLSGIEVLRGIRAEGDRTPVLLLTAKTQIDDRVEGLDAGADDYLTKPFAMKELLARIRSLTRRREEYADSIRTFGDLTLNEERLELTASSTIRLSNREFALLQQLLTHGGHPLAADWLLEHVWPDEPDADTQTVVLYISYLKGKLRSINSKTGIAGDAAGGFCLLLQEA